MYKHIGSHADQIREWNYAPEGTSTLSERVGLLGALIEGSRTGYESDPGVDYPVVHSA